MRVAPFLTLFVGLLTSSCSPQPQTPSDSHALPQGRTILGPAVPWSPLDVDAEKVNHSMTERRKTAWAIAAQALTPVPVINPFTSQAFRDPGTGEDLRIPVWQTWYEVDEFRSMFNELYWKMLTDEQRREKRSDPLLVADIMARFHQRSLLKKWTRPLPDGSTRLDRLLSQIVSDSELSGLNGVSGKGYTLFSPELVRHYLLNYGSIAACEGHDAQYSTGSTEHDFATCFSEPFPKGAVAVKATWSRAQDGVGIFDTSARGITRVLGSERPTWVPENPGAPVYPNPDEIYSSSTFQDDHLSPRYVLTGLHILTKDIPEWMWVTLWWSPKPNEDFGEDRPVLPGQNPAWSHYKMCTVSTFDEQDPVLKQSVGTPDHYQNSTDPSLHAALAAAYALSRPSTFCSNPYIEFQSGAAHTNCIGCHQHAGPFASGAVPKNDRTRQRKSLMSDFLWTFESHIGSFRGAVLDVMENGAP